jgi:N-acetylglucosaminylphosphatidylinositol deacetylase
MPWAVIIICITAVAALLPVALKRRTEAFEQIVRDIREAVIVFAHPDDETMFFLPLISLLNKNRIPFKLLCLSTGDFDGLGKIRIKEIEAVGRALGAKRVDVLDDPRLRDGPIYWDSQAVASSIETYLSKHQLVDVLFTFDDYGVSGHPNHISVHRGVAVLKTPTRYTLGSVSMVRKYFPIFDFFLTLISGPSLVAVNLEDPMLSLNTMQLYGSQNVWFRKLFSVFSRYSYINTFQRLE